MKFFKYINEKLQENVKIDRAKVLTLTRIAGNDSGTVGILKDKEVLVCYTLERPWLNNEPNVSCIPVGEYKCVLRSSPAFGLCYEVMDVQNRTDILLHVGNCSIEDSTGCILVGLQQSVIKDNFLVLNSRDAFDMLMDYFNDEISFYLDIKNL